MLIVRRYAANITSLCGLAVAATTPNLRAAIMREYMQRYVGYNYAFDISLVCPSFYLRLIHLLKPISSPR